MNYFVPENSIVREIWKKTDTVLLIFAGSAAEFALNKAVDWLYYTGKIPTNPLERLFSTVEYAQKIIFLEKAVALATIDSITKIHETVEKQRGQKIPDWAYRDVLYLLIDYSIRSFELLERKLSDREKEELFNVFWQVGIRMHLKNLPQSFGEWQLDRAKHLAENLEKTACTKHLFQQYKKHLGSFRYSILLQIQRVLVPKKVFDKLFNNLMFPNKVMLTTYRYSKYLSLDGVLKTLILPRKYKQQIAKIGQYEKIRNNSTAKR